MGSSVEVRLNLVRRIVGRLILRLTQGVTTACIAATVRAAWNLLRRKEEDVIVTCHADWRLSKERVAQGRDRLGRRRCRERLKLLVDSLDRNDRLEHLDNRFKG